MAGIDLPPFEELRTDLIRARRDRVFVPAGKNRPPMVPTSYRAA